MMVKPAASSVVVAWRVTPAVMATAPAARSTDPEASAAVGTAAVGIQLTFWVTLAKV